MPRSAVENFIAGNDSYLLLSIGLGFIREGPNGAHR